MTVTRFARDSLPATPWKNGGGTTCEIACWPPGAGLDDFLWRASIATIAADGPFSVFPGVDRTILLLDGEGVRLRSPGFDHRLDRPFAPFGFAGETVVDCSLLAGATTDFNLMVRRDSGHARLRVLEAPAVLEPARFGLLMALDGHWFAGALELAPGEGAWWTAEDHAWHCTPAEPGARLMAIRWHPAA